MAYVTVFASGTVVKCLLVREKPTQKELSVLFVVKEQAGLSVIAIFSNSNLR